MNFIYCAHIAVFNIKTKADIKIEIYKYFFQNIKKNHKYNRLRYLNTKVMHLKRKTPLKQFNLITSRKIR
jgi:hypothetical protein